MTPFHEFYNEMTQISSYEELMLKMRVVTKQFPEIPKDQWEATGLYLVFVFQKKGANEPVVEENHKYTHRSGDLIKLDV